MATLTFRTDDDLAPHWRHEAELLLQLTHLCHQLAGRAPEVGGQRVQLPPERLLLELVPVASRPHGLRLLTTFGSHFVAVVVGRGLLKWIQE